MKKLTIALACMALMGNVFAETVKWDFETPNNDWCPWGFEKTEEVTAERADGIISYSNERPHGGKTCLVLRDLFTTVNPYMSLVKPIAVVPDGRYVFGGFARSNTAATTKFVAGIAAEAKDGKFIRWVAMEKFDAAGEWTEFRLTADKLPSETALLRLSVFSHDEKSQTGEICLDDLYFRRIESATNTADQQTK